MAQNLLGPVCPISKTSFCEVIVILFESGLYETDSIDEEEESFCDNLFEEGILLYYYSLFYFLNFLMRNSENHVFRVEFH